MELLHLRTFVTVADTQNLTRAAERLCLSPPSISAHIKALEAELQVPLFVRTVRGMQLTEAGERLRMKAAQTLTLAQELIYEAKNLRVQMSGQITLALNSSARLLRVGTLIAGLAQQYPGLQLTCTNSETGVIFADLRGGAIDVGYAFGDLRDEALAIFPLTTVELVVAVPRRWAAQARGAGWDALAQLPWLTSSVYCPFQYALDQIFVRRQLSYQQIIRPDWSIVTSELVAAGLGLALLERSEADLLPAETCEIIELEPIRCPLGLAYLAERAGDPLIQAFLELAAAVWRDA